MRTAFKRNIPKCANQQTVIEHCVSIPKNRTGYN